MEEIQRSFKGVKGTYSVYTEEEAKLHSLPYVYWKQATLEQWGLTDDGYVANVLAIKVYTDKRGHTRKLVTLSIGKNFAVPSSRIEYEKNRIHKYWSNIAPKSWQDREAGMTRTKNLVTVYVKQLVTGTINYDELGQIYRKDQKIPAATVKRVLKQERIKEMISKALSEELENRGIDQGWALDIMKRAIEIAERRDDPGNMLKGVQQIDEMVNIFPKQAKGALPGFEMGLTRELGEAIQKIDKELENKIPIQADSEEVPPDPKE